MDNLILKQKQTKILLVLKDSTQDWYISTLAKATGTTYVHTCNFLSECERLGIVQSEKHGKLKIVVLTEKGTRLADLISAINPLINPQEQQKQQEPQK